MRKLTIDDAENALKFIQNTISKNATLIGSFGKGSKTSINDIDILIPDIFFDFHLKDKLFVLLKAESVCDTDWGGFYFTNTIFGDIDLFYTTKNFDY